jgi:hypothetical protein
MLYITISMPPHSHMLNIHSKWGSWFLFERGHFLEHSQNCAKELAVSSCRSVCRSAWKNLAPTGQIVMKSDVSVFFENPLKKSSLIKT